MPAFPHADPARGSAASARLREAALAAAAFGALTLPDPRRRGPRGQHLLRLGSAGLAGWAGWKATQLEEVPFVPPAALGAAGSAALALALAPVEESTDRWLQSRLEGAGLRRPRVAMALLAAGVAALAWAWEPEPARDEADEELLDEDEEHDLDPALRELLVALLSVGEPTATATALAQLEQARARGAGGFESTMVLAVPEGGPRLVPYSQTWPVRARWQIDGHPVELAVQVHEGRLEHAFLAPVVDAYPADVDPDEVTPIDDPGNTWPTPDLVELVRDTPDGVQHAGQALR